MFYSLFSLPVLLGLLIALPLIPVLIHLINMMRHRRVKWAAMDFLMQSYRKHRNWIWLKQLLLLLLRMAAVALVVIMLAGLGCRRDLAGWLSGTSTHLYVLLDDSYSMSDRVGGATAFDRANQAIARIAERAAQQEGRQKFTLIRYSRAAGTAGTAPNSKQVDQIADLNAETVDANFGLLLEEKRRSFDVSQLAVGSRAALNVVQQLLDQGPDEKPVVYIVSDFRAKEWANPAEVSESLRKLKDAGSEIQLISCVREERPNLAVTDVKPADETRAAGVPFFVYVQVHNFGKQPAKKVQVKIRTLSYDTQSVSAREADQITGEALELPSVLIDEIPPGEAVTSRAQVFFGQAGQHVVEASLPEDSVSTDNRRWCVVNLAQGEPVLLIDGSSNQQNAYYLMSAFEPGERTNTGVRPSVQPAAFLRDATIEELNSYSSIYLLDVDRLDAKAVESLEGYVRGGGGLAIFTGPKAELSFYNDRLYRNGEGLFPLPLERDDLLAADFEENVPDIEITDHPIFRFFLGERNSLLRLVTVERFLTPPANWTPQPDSTVEVIARLRNGKPLVVERKFGEGRVVALLTTLGPDWNNWALDASFVVMVLKLQSHLAATQRQDAPRLVGAPIDLQLDSKQYLKEVSFVVPGDNSASRMLIVKPAVATDSDSPLITASIGRPGKDAAFTTETGRSGVYEALPMTVEGETELHRYAVNVEPNEGDLELADSRLVLTKLESMKPRFMYWDEYIADPMQEAGLKWSRWILYLMIFLLLGEQLLAYSASYHPVRGGNR